jgi:penicillin-binding protein 1A
LLLVGFGSFIGVLVFAAVNMPAWNPEQLTGADATLLYDDEGQVFHRLHAEENRTAIELNKVPANLLNAFIDTEDREFTTITE